MKKVLFLLAPCYPSLILQNRDAVADMETLNKAVSRLNHTSPAGVFYVDYDGGRLLYKLGVPLPAEIKEEDLYEEMNIVVGNALSILDPSLDELMGIVEGV